MTSLGRLQFCRSGKRAYSSRQDAESGARRLLREFGYFRAYLCPSCGFWHLTSRPWRNWSRRPQ